MYTLEKGNKYILDNIKKVNNQFRLKYHMMPPFGWMNDPNGVIHYKNEYHVFYQFYPYDSKWGPMHWGHSISNDLITYKDLDIALAPDLDDETGCFSGGAILNQSNKEELLLFYTKHYEENKIKKESQNIARSIDGVNFIKDKVVAIDTDNIPNNADKIEFRDPNPVYVNGNYYILIGSRDNNGKGQILVYKSSDLKEYTYHFTIGPNEFTGVMGECPDYFSIDGYGVILFSTIELEKEENRFKNVNSSLYMIGEIDLEKKICNIDRIEEIDKGHDFYAPQTLLDNEGRRVMISWMEMWNKKYYTHENGHDWCGAMTIPRTLSIVDGLLNQYPVKTISDYYGNVVEFNERLINKQCDIILNLKPHDCVIKFENPSDSNDYFEIGQRENKVYLDSTNVLLDKQDLRKTTFYYLDEYELRILIDTSSVEIFVDNGKEAITSRMFMDCEKYKVKISSKEELSLEGRIITLNV